MKATHYIIDKKQFDALNIFYDKAFDELKPIAIDLSEETVKEKATKYATEDDGTWGDNSDEMYHCYKDGLSSVLDPHYMIDLDEDRRERWKNELD